MFWVVVFSLSFVSHYFFIPSLIVIPEASETHFFFLLCSMAVISIMPSSSSLIHASALVVLLLISSSVFFHFSYYIVHWASLVVQRLKRLPAMWETWVRSLGREDPLEKEMAAHSSILAWRILVKHFFYLLDLYLHSVSKILNHLYCHYSESFFR